MIHSIKISGYRAFEKFEMGGLGRINLLVGRNNTGKTSILEGLYMLASGSDPTAVWNVLARRGEQLVPEPMPTRGNQPEVDVSHLFQGHEVIAGKEFSFSTTNDKPARAIQYRVDEVNPTQHPQLFAHLADEPVAGPRLGLWISGTAGQSLPPIALSKLGSIRIDSLQQYVNVQRKQKDDTGSTQYVTTESFSVGQLIQLWNSIVLTPNEDRVVKALQIIEPHVERIAQVQVGPVQYPGIGYSFPNRGGFFVREIDDKRRFPIGTYGDGIWRMLSVAVALVRAKDNMLLVDEIDTGLHYTVMTDMWKMVNDAAKELNVQVFATTHSYDAVHSLAAICSDVEDAQSAITIQRIERGNRHAIPFTESEILIAAERKIEIR